MHGEACRGMRLPLEGMAFGGREVRLLAQFFALADRAVHGRSISGVRSISLGARRRVTHSLHRSHAHRERSLYGDGLIHLRAPRSIFLRARAIEGWGCSVNVSCKVAALWLQAVVTACQSASTTQGSTVPAPVSAPTPSLASTPTPVPTSTRPPVNSAEQTRAEAGLGPITGSNPTLFACGKTSCKAQEQTCCRSTDKSICVASVPPGKNDQVQVLASQIEACERGLGPNSVQAMSRCDESGDCGANEACCHQYVFSGTGANLCVPIGPGKTTPCDFGERCQEGQPCRVGDAECVEGLCRKRVKRLRCGAAYCRPGTSCCGSPARCLPHAECKVCSDGECWEGNARYRCTQASDCLAGETCWYASGLSQCADSSVLAGVAAVVCNRDADCPNDDVTCPGKPWRCAAVDDGSPLRTCTCP
jgi:hypothetical protein